MNDRIQQLLSDLTPYGKEVFVELAQLLYLGKTDDCVPIELTQVFTDAEALEQAMA